MLVLVGSRAQAPQVQAAKAAIMAGSTLQGASQLASSKGNRGLPVVAVRGWWVVDAAQAEAEAERVQAGKGAEGSRRGRRTQVAEEQALAQEGERAGVDNNNTSWHLVATSGSGARWLDHHRPSSRSTCLCAQLKDPDHAHESRHCKIVFSMRLGKEHSEQTTLSLGTCMCNGSNEPSSQEASIVRAGSIRTACVYCSA
jgi:hypothetical protein